MSLFRRAAKDSVAEYQKRIDEGLNAAHGAASVVEPQQVKDLRVVVFSDLHRGARDGADDFERCEPAYSAALGWYLESGYELFLLGDVEELWENDFREVLDAYREAAVLERHFADGNGITRFFGNHDLDWKRPERVRDHLVQYTGPLEVIEALRMPVLDGDHHLGELFFVHGHQGTDLSDRGAWVSRLALRRVWRPLQRSQGWLSTTPADNHDLRAKHDAALFEWARNRVVNAPADQTLALIAGHTHHPVFPSAPQPVPSSADAARLLAAVEEQRVAQAPPTVLAPLRAAAERARAFTHRRIVAPLTDDPPCYFNTGCCCFPDRRVTGLEIADEKIRLVSWSSDGEQPRPQPMGAAMALTELFGRLAAA
jgi:UDP-2,3-diacylglucosamine pyrophosphatase LpxH